MSDYNHVVFSRKLLKKFILLYKELTCLWDRDVPDYRLKAKKHAALSKLTELVQQYDPNATRVHVLRKIDSLRACVRREYKRVQESRRLATCEDDIYKPNLWYYDLFSFVFKEDDARDGDGVLVIDESAPPRKSDSEPEEDEDEEEDDEPFEDNHQESYDIEPFQPTEYNIPVNTVEVDRATSKKHPSPVDSEPYKNKRTKAGTEVNDEYDAIEYNIPVNTIEVDRATSKKHPSPVDGEPFRNKRNKASTEVNDEYDAIGINVAAKLRNLPANMRILAEKLINDVLFQAQINGLHSSTKIITTDPFKLENCFPLSS